MDRKKDIIQALNDLSGRYSAYEVFSDWVRTSAIAVQNASVMIHDKVWEKRESDYMDTMKRYSPGEQDKMSEMFYLLVETMEEGYDDVLGSIFMQAGLGSGITGQFFTPYNISRLCGRMAVDNQIEGYHEGDLITLHEPTCGSGGMIIAAAECLKERGINYQRVLEVVAQDLDWRCVCMTYLQLSLYGIKALVVQGDTLADPYIEGRTEKSRIMRTPAWMGALL